MMLLRGASKLRCDRRALRACAGISSWSCNPSSSSSSSSSSSNFKWAALGTAGAVGTLLFSQPALTESDNSSGGFFFGRGPSVSVSTGAGAPSNPSNADLEKEVQDTREELREMLKPYRSRGAPIPPVFVDSKGQQVSVRFAIPPACDIYQVVVEVLSKVGANGTDMSVRAINSAVGRQLTISHPDAEKNPLLSNDLCVVIFEPCVGDKTADVEFLKKGRFSQAELDTVLDALRASAGIGVDKAARRKSDPRKGKRAIEALEKLGVKIYGLDTVLENGNDQIAWDTIAGYHEQKREIEDSILLALKRPEVYESIARGTRNKYESNRPRAVLFEGPPGTGKTSCARVIASQAGVPLLYVPLEIVTSRYYGESEKLLSNVFNAGKELPDGAIVFLDEIDSLATTRDTDMHEASRRMLSVLLRQMDGFEQDKRVVVIAATNRKQDLDPALLSRFDAAITFDLPDSQTREEIVAQYARHLAQKELTSVAAASEGMSGRDLREVCQQAERRWASKLIKGLVGNPPTQNLPPVQEYIESAEKRRLSHVKPVDEQVSIRIAATKPCLK